MKYFRKLFVFSMIPALISLVSCASSTPTTISIYQGDTLIGDRVYVEENETITLSAVTDSKNSYDCVWTVSDTSIATINNDGELTGVSEGDAIITVALVDLPYITTSIYVTVSAYLGHGTTIDDPIVVEGDESDKIEVYFLEMQHIYADTIYIKKGDIDILIDSGWSYDGEYVSTFLDEHVTDGRLEMLMLSHSDSDHIQGLANALQNIDEISFMIDYGGTSSGTVGELRSREETTYYSAYDSVNAIDGASDRYYFTDDFYVDILDTGNYITSTTSSAGNRSSVAAIFTYKDFTYFTGGDLTSAAERQLLANEDLPEVTLFKAHHHGSSGSNTQELLDTLNPKGIAISAARANQYNSTPGPASQSNTYNLDGTSGHPHAAAIERFYKAPNISRNLNVYWNAVNGTMKFISYGQDAFIFEGSETIKGYYDLTLTGGTPVWNSDLNDWENKVTGEENLRLHETKMFEFREYESLLPSS